MTNMYYICQYIGAEYSHYRGVGVDLKVGVRKLLSEPKSGVKEGYFFMTGPKSGQVFNNEKNKKSPLALKHALMPFNLNILIYRAFAASMLSARPFINFRHTKMGRGGQKHSSTTFQNGGTCPSPPTATPRH
jgi:hypothetical protein